MYVKKGEKFLKQFQKQQKPIKKVRQLINIMVMLMSWTILEALTTKI